MKNLYFSLFIGIIGIFLVSYTFLYYYGGPAGAHPTSSIKFVAKFIEEILTERTPNWIGTFFYYFLGFGFLGFLFLSPIGIFTGVKSYYSSKSKLAILGIILNVINFIFSLFIAWLLFGLARGM